VSKLMKSDEGRVFSSRFSASEVIENPQKTGIDKIAALMEVVM